MWYNCTIIEEPTQLRRADICIKPLKSRLIDNDAHFSDQLLIVICELGYDALDKTNWPYAVWIKLELFIIFFLNMNYLLPCINFKFEWPASLFKI